MSTKQKWTKKDVLDWYKNNESGQDAINPPLFYLDYVLVWHDPTDRTGGYSHFLYPAWQGDKQCWLKSTSWDAASPYKWAEGREEIIPFEEGVKLMIEHGKFAFQPPD